MEDIAEIAKILEVKGAVNSRKIAEDTFSSAGQMERVLAYQKKMPGHIHYVNDLAWTGSPSMVVVMTTTGRNSGVGILLRMRRGDDGDLRRAWLCMDVVEGKVVGEWKCFGLHVYSFTQRRLLTIATVYIKSTTGLVYNFAFDQVERICLKFDVIVDCYGFISDAEGAIVLAVKGRYKVSDDRYQECVFHFNQNSNRVVDRTLPAMKRCEHLHITTCILCHNCCLKLHIGSCSIRLHSCFVKPCYNVNYTFIQESNLCYWN